MSIPQHPGIGDLHRTFLTAIKYDSSKFLKHFVLIAFGFLFLCSTASQPALHFPVITGSQRGGNRDGHHAFANSTEFRIYQLQFKCKVR